MAGFGDDSGEKEASGRVTTTEGFRRCSYKQYGHYILTRKSFDHPVRSVSVHVFIGQLKVSRDGRLHLPPPDGSRYAPSKGPRQRLVLSLGTLDLPKSEWPRLAERIEDLVNHQLMNGYPFGTSDQGPTAAPFAERIRSKQQRQQAQRDGHGPAKEAIPHAAAVADSRTRPGIRRARILGAPALRPYPAALRILSAAVPVGRDPAWWAD